MILSKSMNFDVMIFSFTVRSFDVIILHFCSAQFWKYAVTGANKNQELKVWSCESWNCLQTIRWTASVYLYSHKVLQTFGWLLVCILYFLWAVFAAVSCIPQVFYPHPYSCSQVDKLLPSLSSVWHVSVHALVTALFGSNSIMIRAIGLCFSISSVLWLWNRGLNLSTWSSDFLANFFLLTTSLMEWKVCPYLCDLLYP